MKFPGITSPWTFDELSAVMRSHGFTWAWAGTLVKPNAIIEANAAIVATLRNFMCESPGQSSKFLFNLERPIGPAMLTGERRIIRGLAPACVSLFQRRIESLKPRGSMCNASQTDTKEKGPSALLSKIQNRASLKSFCALGRYASELF